VAGLRLGGLSSGLDTETIIGQLMALERQPKARLTNEERRAEGRKTALEDVARSLRAFKNAATDLRSTATWGDTQTFAVADATKLAGRTVGVAPAGTYTVDVQWFARAEQRSYDYAEVDDPGTPGADDQQLTIGGVPVTIPAGTSDQGVVDAINATSGIGVLAGLVNGRLTLTGKTVGQPFTVTSSTGSVLNESVEAARKNRYSVNGIQQDDTLDMIVKPGGLPGVELTLKAIGSTTVTIGASGTDTEKVKAKIKAFVDSYNATIDLVRGKLTEKPIRSPSTVSELQKGTLYSDPGLSTVLSRLRQTMGETLAGFGVTGNELADFGIGVPVAQTGPVSADRLAGKLVIDDAKLSAALAANPAAVKDFFTSATGFGAKVESFVDPLSRVGDGAMALRSTEVDRQIQRIRAQSTEMDKRLELKEQRLRAQFTQLEMALGRSQTQQSWLTGQLAGLNNVG
jgi:flagellar hook-associated protein 2